MKTIIKLVFLGVVIAVAVNYLDKHNIDAPGMAKTILERVVSEIEKLSETVESETEANAVDFFSDDAVVEYDPYSEVQETHTDNYSESEQEIEVTDENADYTEFYTPAMPEDTGNPFIELDRHAASVPEDCTNTMDDLVNYLVKPARNDIEKTRLIFTWIALNVAYDDYGYNTGHYSDCSPEGVFRNRRAVCQGFSELFERMGKLAGLDIVLVIGYAKGISHTPGEYFPETNHAWNVVKINGRWRLFDVTWAQGCGRGVNGRLVSTKEFNGFWFDTDPEAFIFSHLPEDPQWQLTEVTITKSQFENLPYVSNSYFKMGFDGGYCLRNALNGNLDAFPLVYSIGGNVQVVSLPYQQTVRDGNAYRFRVRAPEASGMAIINNGHWVHMKKEGDEFSAIVQPLTGDLCVSVKFDRGLYYSMLEYRVN